jgi:hypothetical protein
MMNSKSDYGELLELVAKFHSISNTAWPKPGEPALAGASIFIGTTLFRTLEHCTLLIQEAVEAMGNNDSRREIENFLTAFKLLFSAVGQRDRGEKSEQVDFAFNILYLASGVLYHRITEISSRIPEDRFTLVEPFNKLLELCRWPGKIDNVKAVFDSLASAMMSCAQDLHE